MFYIQFGSYIYYFDLIYFIFLNIVSLQIFYFYINVIII